jgi:hypothetical protein
MVDVGTVLILLIIFGSIVTLILGAIYLKNKNRERMAILAHGADPSLLRDNYRPAKNFNLKLGVLFVSVAIGIIVGYILDGNYIISEGVAYFSSIFLFGGFGLLLGSFIDYVSEKDMKK